MPEKLGPPPPGLDITESRQPQVYAAFIVVYTLAVISVFLRLISRRIARSGYWLDDYLMVAALLFATGNFVAAIIETMNGNGRHVWFFGAEGHDLTTERFKILFVDELLYNISMATVKYSILAFYWRIFSVPSIRRPIYALAAIVTVWWITVSLIAVFQCTPIEGAWNHDIHAKCNIPPIPFFIGISVPNIVTDFCLLALPLPYIMKLKRNIAQRLALASLFLLGGCVCVISIIRLTNVVHANAESPDILWNFTDISIWTETEIYMALISANLPSIRPVVTLLIPSFMHVSKADSKPDVKGGSSKYLNLKASNGAGAFNMRSRQKDDDTSHLVTIGSTRGGTLAARRSELELARMEHGITVKKDVDVRWGSDDGTV